jgi:hypothetical protein
MGKNDISETLDFLFLLVFEICLVEMYFIFKYLTNRVL